MQSRRRRTMTRETRSQNRRMMTWAKRSWRHRLHGGVDPKGGAAEQQAILESIQLEAEVEANRRFLHQRGWGINKMFAELEEELELQHAAAYPSSTTSIGE
jgi:hypothetical protein